jgi:hypothetical protein
MYNRAAEKTKAGSESELPKATAECSPTPLVARFALSVSFPSNPFRPYDFVENGQIACLHGQIFGPSQIPIGPGRSIRLTYSDHIANSPPPGASK